MGPRTSLTLYEGMTGIMRTPSSTSRAARTRSPPRSRCRASGANGVIIAQAGRFGGWSLYMKGGRAHHVYNFGGLERTTASSAARAGAGRTRSATSSSYDGGKPGSGGTSRLSVDGKPAGEARVRGRCPSSTRPTRASTSGWTTRRL